MHSFLDAKQVRVSLLHSFSIRLKHVCKLPDNKLQQFTKKSSCLKRSYVSTSTASVYFSMCTYEAIFIRFVAITISAKWTNCCLYDDAQRHSQFYVTVMLAGN